MNEQIEMIAASGAGAGMREEFRPSLFRTLRSLLTADFAVLLRNRRSLIVSIMLPLLVLVMSRKATNSNSDLLLSLSITFGLFPLSIMGYSLSTARDREKGVFQRLRVTPAPAWTIMVSRIAVQMAACLAVAVVAMVVAAEADNIILTPAGYALTLVVTVIAAALFLSIGQALVGLLKSADTVTSVGRFVYIAMVLFGMFGESGRLGSGVQTAATWSPFGTVTSMLSGAMSLDLSGATWLAVLASAGYIIVFASAGIRWFRWDVNR